MSLKISFKTHNDLQECYLDVIFVHGLTGDPEETWTNEDEFFWPEWLVEDLTNVKIHTLGYPASLFKKFAEKEMDLYERAENVLEYMVAKGVGESRPVVFVTHSLGGLLIKQVLRIAKDTDNEDWNSLFEKTNMVCFLATSHTGASLASILNFVIPRFSSEHISSLEKGSSYLTDLNKAYRDFAPAANIKTIAYYEKYKTKKAALIVTPESSDPGVIKCRPIAVDADHITICKPKSKDAFIYCSLLLQIRKCLPNVESDVKKKLSLEIFDDEDYVSPSLVDRRDLLTKLVEAGRESEYAIANDYQSAFARRYVKLGLHSEAKQRSDDLLSDIEQRFNTHVYNTLICNGASDAEIADALQEKIIDPLYLKHKDIIDGITPKAILKALYFLTEQCFIRWDAA